ncbi:hypothetical protein E2C01_086758 [Portunus trituberculatus]|uniref:Uncharacterized protein n=1 Tax=Portunus trituberculatus TaxID=210409 RepID=A0A5B7J687_PORTR|nr:hypothetical protein [Portunus trituberculatus]
MIFSSFSHQSLTLNLYHQSIHSFILQNTSPTTTRNSIVLSEYEQMVQRNIAERQRMLESLGILKAKEELFSSVQESKKKPVYRGIIREKKSPEP